MAGKKTRTSIERRFVMSILWVGVIPMMLALIIGYFAAREAQQISVMQNLSTAARKTVAGVRLVVKERERDLQRVAQSPEILNSLRAYQNDRDISWETVQGRFIYESIVSDKADSIYYLYDRDGIPVTSFADAPPPRIPNLTRLTNPRFVDFDYQGGDYLAILVTPVVDQQSDAILGFLAERQNIQDLLVLILEDTDSTKSGRQDRYEIVVYSPETGYILYLDEAETVRPPPPRFEPLHPRLAERIGRDPEQEEDAFIMWRYTARGKTTPVLMAYHRLAPDLPVYIAVHQPTPDVFAVINIAAGVTVCISAIIIGIFCAAAYRIVNNNIIRPVSLLNEGAQILRQGDLELKLKVDTGDEIEELASSFNQMATALRANMRRVRESEGKYRHLVTSMRDGIFQTNAGEAITFINPSGVAILGYDAIGDILGHTLSDFFVSREEYERVAGELTHLPYIENTRVWLKKSREQDICVELSGNYMLSDLGELKGIEGVFRDVTRNVRLENEVAERAERMATVNQIANVVNSSVEAGRVYENLAREVRRLIDFDYVSVSIRMEDGAFDTRQLWPEPRTGRERFSRMDGEDSCAGWVEREKRYLVITQPSEYEGDFALQFPDAIQSCLCVPLYAQEHIIGTLNFGCKENGGYSGRETTILEQIAPHLAAAIRNAQLLESLKNSLEEVTLAREKLHAANEELTSLDEMKTNLLSNVSHELRTPLVAVMGYTDMILNAKAGPINDTQREYLGIVLRNVEKLTTLIENLLDFSRLHRGAEELLFDRFDLVDCIEASIQSVRPMATPRSIALELRLYDESGAPIEAPVTVEGDKGKLGQVFNNLLSNAVKFNNTEGKVTVEVEIRKDTVYIAVVDTGIGMPQEALDKIFARFYQYDGSSTRKYGGAGIGLAISQDIVRLHGSRITVSSREGEGSTFRFTLPLYRPAAPEAESPELPLPIETHLLIELVTQDRALSAQIRNYLISEGMDVIHAAYPSAAVSLVQKYNPDCIILDTESGPSGRMLLEEVINAPLSVSMPIVLLTDDEELYLTYQGHLGARIRRNFRKSSLLSGIHYALSQGAPTDNLFGDRILCVDADHETTVFIERCLTNEGYAVDSCRAGEEALAKAESGVYWLILLEVDLPGVDGWHTCRRLKENPNLTGIKVYLVTARAVDKQTAEVRDCGADGYLVKPFKADDILSVVRAFDAQRGRLGPYL